MQQYESSLFKFYPFSFSVYYMHVCSTVSLIMATIDGSVSQLSASSISPATPTNSPHCLALPFYDAVWLDIPHNQSILFYTLDRGVDYPSLVAHLKHSLSLVLNHYFLWAGKLARLQNGSLALICNDRGVEFLEAVCEDVDMDALEKTHFQQNPSFFNKLVPLGDKTLIEDLNLPLFSVQVTRLGMDGLSIGFASTHVVCDGSSFWTFMASWSECGRGVPISTPPLHMRSVVENPQFKEEEEEGNKPEGMAKNNSEADGCKLEERVFHFSAEAMKKLKDLSTQNGEGPYSSFECLCAHMWRQTTAARRVGDEQKLRLSVLANTRRRLEPPLPDAYFGNSLFPIRVFATAGDLLRKDNLASTARKLHEAIISCNHAAIQAFTKQVQNLSPDEAFEPERDVIGTTVVNSPKFPAYNLDFGFGRPSAVRIARIREEGVMMLFPGREGGGSVDVTIALPAEVLQHLENDNELLLV